MRRWLLVAFLAAFFTTAAAAQTAFQASLGVDAFRYDRAFLMMGIAHLTDLAEQMELHLGADFGITTDENSSGKVEPSFLIPVDVGLNFTFPQGRSVFYVGAGITPNFLFDRQGDQEFRLYMGPYARAGVRLQVHAIMSAFVDVQQDLLIGRPDWINASTQIGGGIYWSFP